MSQLKQDEWPADGEPTTTESQQPPAAPGEELLRGQDLSDPDASDHDRERELTNVTPDEAID